VTGRGWRLDLPPSRVRAAADLRVAVWLDDPACPTDPEVLDVLESAAGALEAAGARVDRGARPPFPLAEARDVAFALWVAASSERTPDEEVERLRKVARRDGDSLVVQRARAETMSHREWLRLDTDRRRLQTGWLALLDDHDVLLCPVEPVAAIEHDPDPDAVASVDHRLERTIDVGGQPRPYLDQIVWPTCVNMGGLPATAAPVGLTPRGLPVGAQVVARPGEDRTTIAVAGLLAEVTGGAGRPPGYG
jgi:amidase